MQNKKQPLVTVTLPTHNRKELLIKSIESVLAQNYKNFELLIGDNNSSDETDIICKKYCENDSRIKYYRHSTDIGAFKNGQFLLNQTKGKYWVALCDDDRISPNYIKEAVKVLENKPNASFAYTTVKWYDEHNNLEGLFRAPNIKGNSFEKRLILFFTYMKEHKLCGQGVYRTDNIKKMMALGKNRICEDQILVLKMLYFGDMINARKATYHKLNNGISKDIPTAVKNFGLDQNISLGEFENIIAQMHSDAIFNDDFYKEKFTNFEREHLAELAVSTMKFFKNKKPRLPLSCQLKKTVTIIRNYVKWYCV